MTGTNQVPDVDVYHNFPRNLWSVRQKKVVVDRAEEVVLRDALFVVSEAGRQRVLKERRKNVHAVVRGRLDEVSTSSLKGWVRITYNPYLGPTFVVRSTGRPVYRAAVVRFTADRQCYAKGLSYHEEAK